jgi:hypothetical protein
MCTVARTEDFGLLPDTPTVLELSEIKLLTCIFSHLIVAVMTQPSESRKKCCTTAVQFFILQTKLTK